MADHHYGTSTDPAHFVELLTVPVETTDDEVVRVAPRPAAGTVLLARNAATLADLASITLDENGYWSAIYEDVPAILVSGDAGATWIGPLYSAEAQAAAMTSGVNAQQALTNSASAITTAQQALAIAQAGGGGGGGGGGSLELIRETSAGVYPAPVSTVTRIFIGSVRPTSGQGRRTGDFWWNTVLTP